MIYIEHSNPHQPPSLRRYDSRALAVLGIARSTHLPANEIEATLKVARSVRLARDVWRIVSLDEMCRRTGAFARATQAMARGEDVDPNDIP